MTMIAGMVLAGPTYGISHNQDAASDILEEQEQQSSQEEAQADVGDTGNNNDNDNDAREDIQNNINQQIQDTQEEVEQRSENQQQKAQNATSGQPEAVDEGSQAPQQPSSESKKEELKETTPSINISFPRGTTTLSKMVNVTIQVKGAKKVELLRRHPNSLAETYIGQARQAGNDRYRLQWNTTNTPNGDHIIFARVKNRFGTYTSGDTRISVDNQSTPIPEDKLKRQAQEKARQLLPPVTNKQDVQDSSSQPTLSEKIQKELQEKGISTGAESREKGPEKTKQARQKAEEGRDQARQQVEQGPASEVAEETLQALEKKQKDRLQRARQFFEDLDQDGLTKAEEKRFGTSDRNPDSDGDGVLDGIEVLGGSDPTKPGGLDDPVEFEEPIDPGAGEANPQNWQVTDAQFDPKKETTTLRGKALPNSIVVLYVYSIDPTVVTVKADDSGNWEYTLDRELSDGEHEAYVAITDNEGKIVEKSPPLRFVKQASAITVLASEDQVEAGTVQTGSGTEDGSLNQILLVALLVVASLILVLLIIAFLVREQSTP